MKKRFIVVYTVVILGIVFANWKVVKGFQLTLKRDPFMDLLKYRQLKEKELIKEKNQPGYLEEEAGYIKSSLKVKMVVTSPGGEGKAALLVGPSGVPIVVMEGYKLKNGVYVNKITSDGVVIEIKEGNKKKFVTLKIKR